LRILDIYLTIISFLVELNSPACLPEADPPLLLSLGVTESRVKCQIVPVKCPFVPVKYAGVKVLCRAGPVKCFTAMVKDSIGRVKWALVYGDTWYCSG